MIALALVVVCIVVLLVGLWKSLGWIRWAPTRVDLLKKLCPPRTHDAR